MEVAVEVLVSSADTIRVNREDKPAELVKEQYRRLNMFQHPVCVDLFAGDRNKSQEYPGSYGNGVV